MQKTLVISAKPKSTVRLTLKPKPRKSKNGRLCCWDGYEELRDKLVKLAKQVVIADAAAEVATKRMGWSTTGAICQSIRDPNIPTIPEVAEAARLFRELRDLQHQLIWEYNFDGNFVVKEVTIILDPNNNIKQEGLFDSYYDHQ